MENCGFVRRQAWWQLLCARRTSSVSASIAISLHHKKNCSRRVSSFIPLNSASAMDENRHTNHNRGKHNKTCTARSLVVWKMTCAPTAIPHDRRCLASSHCCVTRQPKEVTSVSIDHACSSRRPGVPPTPIKPLEGIKGRKEELKKENNGQKTRHMQQVSKRKTSSVANTWLRTLHRDNLAYVFDTSAQRHHM